MGEIGALMARGKDGPGSSSGSLSSVVASADGYADGTRTQGNFRLCMKASDSNSIYAGDKLQQASLQVLACVRC